MHRKVLNHSAMQIISQLQLKVKNICKDLNIATQNEINADQKSKSSVRIKEAIKYKTKN